MASERPRRSTNEEAEVRRGRLSASGGMVLPAIAAACGCWQELQPWRPDVGTNANFCFHRCFSLLEPSLVFAFLLPPFCGLLQPVSIFATTDFFDFSGTSARFFIFATTSVSICWNKLHFLLPSGFWFVGTASIFSNFATNVLLVFAGTAMNFCYDRRNFLLRPAN